MELRRWPRKNDPGSIEARQKALGLSDGVTRIDLSPFVNAQEMLTGAAVIPVSVVGPLVWLVCGRCSLRWSIQERRVHPAAEYRGFDRRRPLFDEGS